MDWQAIGAVGEVLGAAAVVASLVYLARQVRSSAAVIRATAYMEIALGTAETLEDWAQDDVWHELVVRVFFEGTGRDDFTPAERIKISFHLLALLRLFEAAYHQYREGVVSEEILEVCDSALLRTQYFAESWPIYRPELSRAFATFLDSHLELPTPANTTEVRDSKEAHS